MMGERGQAVKRYSIILELPEGKPVEVCHCDANPEAIAAVVRAKHPLARVGIRDNQPAGDNAETWGTK